MKPAQTTLFIAAILSALALIGTCMPTAGVRIGGLVLEFPDPGSMLYATPRQAVDISRIIALKTDTAATPDTLDVVALDPLRDYALDYPDNDPRILRGILQELETAAAGSHPLRVLHYGDSQLEGDRITSYLRNRLQTRFGGSGLGLVPVLDVGPSFSVDREASSNWIRYSVMEKQKPPLGHQRFGALWAFTRFTRPRADSLIVDSVQVEGTIVFRKVKRAYGRSQQYSTCRVFFGHHLRPVTIALQADDEAPVERSFQASASLLIADFDVPSSAKAVKLTFRGADSPEVYGVSLEGSSGVCVDNLSARGASGTELGRIDKAHLQTMLDALNVELLILQYGGNAVPYVTSTKHAQQYGEWFGAQVAQLKRLLPGVAVIVIGPSDMAIKEGTTYVTRPFVEDVNDALRQNALSNGAAYFDLFSAMGGRNSMVSWVNADPPLAATDYTHFSPEGAAKMAELFYTALLSDMQALEHPKAKDAL